MLYDIITGSSNAKIKDTAALKEKKYRDQTGLFVAEGERIVDEIPPDWDVEYFVLSESFAKKRDIKRFTDRARAYVAADHLFARTSAAKSPQGVLAVCRQRTYDISAMLKQNALLLLLEHVRDPGNAGAILRIADAAGVGGVILSENCVDIYNPKAVSAAAGAVFHLPYVQNANLSNVLEMLKNKGFTTFAAHLDGATFPYSLDFTKNCAIIIGNEANGLTDETSGKCDYRVKIPIVGSAESLNASVACGILVYEAVRQRLFL